MLLLDHGVVVSVDTITRISGSLSSAVAPAAAVVAVLILLNTATGIVSVAIGHPLSGAGATSTKRTTLNRVCHVGCKCTPLCSMACVRAAVAGSLSTLLPQALLIIIFRFRH